MKKLTLLLCAMLTVSLGVMAQNAITPAPPAGAAGIMTNPMNYLIVFVMIILLSTILVMARTIRLLLWQIAGAPKQTDKADMQKPAEERKPSLLARLNKKMNDAVPVEKEADVLLDHDYDGIKELDNNLPPWWKYGFYLTILFAFVYMIHYHVTGSGNVQLDEFNEQIAEAELQKTERLKLVASNVDETNVTILTAPDSVSQGQKIYAEKCLVCHGKAGEGLVGPNLTDDYWIHGGSIKDVFKIIKYGFPSKGMLAWQGQLTPVQIQEVASYIKSIRGTNPPNAKEAQGDLFKEEEEANPTVITADSTVIAAVADTAVTTM